MADIERIVPHTPEWEAFYCNHIFRYRWALSELPEAPKTLVDAACGVGYGTQFLARNLTQTQCVGMDVSEEALHIAQTHFSDQRVQYLLANCENLPETFNDAIDAFVCLETFEHLPHPDLFLASVKRVLKPGGQLILSCPNRLRYSEYPTGDWEYHEKEYTHAEMVEILEHAGFEIKKAVGQTFSSIGNLRNDFRKELNRLRSNPFARLGRWVQEKAKGLRKNEVVLPEKEEDFAWEELREGANEKAFVLMYSVTLK